jgi:hypothetical protein
MDVFIYIPLGSGAARDDVEDALDDWLAGRGEVTGAGSGRDSSSIDLDVTDPALSAAQALAEVRQVLESLGLPAATRIVVDREPHLLRPG